MEGQSLPTRRDGLFRPGLLVCKSRSAICLCLTQLQRTLIDAFRLCSVSELVTVRQMVREARSLTKIVYTSSILVESAMRSCGESSIQIAAGMICGLLWSSFFESGRIEDVAHDVQHIRCC